jgi:serine/threonine protein kinase
MPANVPCHPLPAGFRIEHYRIERQIAFGGFSMVYLAYDAAESPVAIKEYLPLELALRAPGEIEPRVEEACRASFNAGLKCFFEEGRALSRLNHRHVVRVTDFFRAHGTAYMVMAFERGRTLREHVKRHSGAVPEPFVRDTFIQALDGLQEVHRNGLLHLDLKPANIFLRSDGTPLLLDFGATREAAGRGTARLSSIHTPGYAAPEQQGAAAGCGPWTDIYGIGASLYFCLAGASPPPAEARCDKDVLVPAGQRWRGRYSAPLLQLIDDCLQLEPGRRPQSALALRTALADLPAPLPAATTMLGKFRGRIGRLLRP